MGKNIVIVILAVVSLAAIGFGILGSKDRVVLERESAASLAEKEDLATELGKARDQIEELKSDFEKLKSAVTTAPEAVPAETASAGSGTDKKKKRGASSPFAGIMKGMRDDPAMREMMEKQQSIAVDKMFGPLLGNLDLSDEDKATLRELLVERQTGSMEQSFQLMGGEISEEERKALMTEIGEKQKGIKDEIKDLIGEENYEKFELYEKSQTERQQLSSFKEQLDGTGLEISHEKEEALMTAMYEEREAFKFTNKFMKPGEMGDDFTANYNAENLEVFMEEQRRLQEQIYDRVGEMLTPEQLEVFAQSQEAHLTTQEFGMKMGAQMMKGAKEE